MNIKCEMYLLLTYFTPFSPLTLLSCSSRGGDRHQQHLTRPPPQASPGQMSSSELIQDSNETS